MGAPAGINSRGSGTDVFKAAKGIYAFVQHALVSVNLHAIVALVVASGALWRSFEAVIRQNLVELDLVPAVALLPSGLLLNTGLPAALLVLQPIKPNQLQGRVYLLDDSKAKVNPRDEASLAWIDELPALYRQHYEAPDRSGVAIREEIAAFTYNLFPGRYIPLSTTQLESLERVQQEIVQARNEFKIAMQAYEAADRELTSRT